MAVRSGLRCLSAGAPVPGSHVVYAKRCAGPPLGAITGTQRNNDTLYSTVF